MDNQLTRQPDIVKMAFAAWRRPIEPLLGQVIKTTETPLGELTMTDVVAWAAVFGYAFVTGMVIGRMAGNLARVAVRGPVLRR